VLSIPVEAALLAEDAKRSPSLSRPPCWRWMGSAPHPYGGRRPGGGWGALPIPVEAVVLAVDRECFPSLWSRLPGGGCEALPIPVEAALLAVDGEHSPWLQNESISFYL
jgi:hypothetical protein